MVFEGPGEPLRERQVEDPRAGSGQLLLEVATCGVCRTDLHVVDGDLTEPLIAPEEALRVRPVGRDPSDRSH